MHSADFQTLILRMVSFQSGNVENVSKQTGVASSTIYMWLSDWNKSHRLEKKTLISHQGQGGEACPKSSKADWQQWRENLASDEQKHWTGRELRHCFEVQTDIKYSPSH